MRNTKLHHNKGHQSGAALILSMILLLVLTLLGLSSMRTATMEEKMAGNMRDKNISFEAAESALRDGEQWIAQQTNETSIMTKSFAFNKNELVDTNGKPYNLAQQPGSWWASNAAVYGSQTNSTSLAEVTTQPKFIIEEQGYIPDSLVRGFEPPRGKNVYRITARGTGATDTASSITESTYTKRFD